MKLSVLVIILLFAGPRPVDVQRTKEPSLTALQQILNKKRFVDLTHAFWMEFARAQILV